jgi:hypothetical protein
MALTTVSSDRLSTNVKTSNLGTELKKKVGQNKNIIINGAMQVAQRGTSSTTSGYSTVDRFKTVHSGTDEAPTYAQVDVASGTTPYTSGFRKALKITNGNQTSGAGAADFISYAYRIESQDIANSGWNYTSTSSYITLSFWMKSSVAQDFKGYIRSHDGTSQAYAFATGSLSADTWTKITKTIPGNSNLTFDNNNDVGFEIVLGGFWGTDYTDNSVTENAWAAYASGTRMKDNTSTWYTTNDSTIELTGLQLEVGNTATNFEHEDKNTTLRKCQRYCWRFGMVDNAFIFGGIMANTTDARMLAKFPVPMRANPTITINALKVDGEVSGSVETVNSVSGTNFNSDFGGRIVLACDASTVGAGASVMLYTQSSSGYIQGDSEL